MDVKNIRKALVVGAGVMGHSIAQVFAQAGIEVSLVDLNEKILERATNLIKSNLGILAEFKRVPRNKISTILKHIHPTTSLADGAQGADFAIEVVSEVAEVKKKVFAQLDELCSEDIVLASNTSGLDIFSIAEIKKPERLIITHWFAPPHIIPLVEVVPGPKTSKDVVTFAKDLMERLGKRPI